MIDAFECVEFNLISRTSNVDAHLLAKLCFSGLAIRDRFWYVGCLGFIWDSTKERAFIFQAVKFSIDIPQSTVPLPLLVGIEGKGPLKDSVLPPGLNPIN